MTNFLKASSLLVFFIGCNPIRQVISDKEKLDEVAKVVIAMGYCANDTTYITHTDTLLVVDTLMEVLTDTLKLKDTTILWETKFYTINKTKTIRDSIKSVIIDSALVQQLRFQNIELNDKIKADRKRYLWIIGILIFLLIVLFRLK